MNDIVLAPMRAFPRRPLSYARGLPMALGLSMMRDLNRGPTALEREIEAKQEREAEAARLAALARVAALGARAAAA